MGIPYLPGQTLIVEEKATRRAALIKNGITDDSPRAVFGAHAGPLTPHVRSQPAGVDRVNFD
ncbi:hypothetical protein GM30_22830 [Trabulsiella odontotermitis]|nr:hypothetical protein GM30_22830 [Trabulsiella odontotermitis]